MPNGLDSHLPRPFERSPPCLCRLFESEIGPLMVTAPPAFGAPNGNKDLQIIDVAEVALRGVNREMVMVTKEAVLPGNRGADRTCWRPPTTNAAHQNPQRRATS